MPKKPAKPKPPKFSLRWVRNKIGILKELGEAFQALKGKKPITSKVAILSNPENPKSMSIVTRGQAKFVQMAYYVNSVDEWGGHFEGLLDLAKEILAVSPSVDGVGREQVIRLIGAMSESKLLERMGFTAKPQQEKE